MTRIGEAAASVRSFWRRRSAALRQCPRLFDVLEDAVENDVRCFGGEEFGDRTREVPYVNLRRDN